MVGNADEVAAAGAAFGTRGAVIKGPGAVHLAAAPAARATPRWLMRRMAETASRKPFKGRAIRARSSGSGFRPAKSAHENAVGAGGVQVVQAGIDLTHAALEVIDVHRFGEVTIGAVLGRAWPKQ